MQMRPQIQIKSVIKALTDVVLPAVDPKNKLAQEQIRLSIGLLTLLGQQLPVQYQFDRDELKRLLAYADQLQSTVGGTKQIQPALDELVRAVGAGSKALAGSGTSPDALQRAVRELRAVAGAVVTQAYANGDESSQSAVRDLTLAMSADQLIRDRSMLLMQGWEPDPKAIPELAGLLESVEST